MIDRNQLRDIDNTDLGVLYQEFKIEIPAGEIVDFHQYFRSIKLLSMVGTPVDFRFGTAATFTSLTLGIGVEFPRLLPSLSLRNQGNAPTILVIALSNGRVSDDRLNISGDINAHISANTLFSSQAIALDGANAPSPGGYILDNTGFKSVTIQHIDNDFPGLYNYIKVGDVRLWPGDSITLDYAGPIPLSMGIWDGGSLVQLAQKYRLGVIQVG